MNIRHMARGVVSWLVPLLVPTLALAQGLSPAQPFQGTAQSGLIQAITTIINILLILAGLVAAIYLVIGGVQYITSRGDEDAAAEAKSTVLFALLGLLVIGLSAAIVNFIIAAVQSA